MSYCALLKQSLFHYVRIKILLLLLCNYVLCFLIFRQFNTATNSFVGTSSMQTNIPNTINNVTIPECYYKKAEYLRTDAERDLYAYLSQHQDYKRVVEILHPPVKDLVREVMNYRGVQLIMEQIANRIEVLYYQCSNAIQYNLSYVPALHQPYVPISQMSSGSTSQMSSESTTQMLSGPTPQMPSGSTSQMSSSPTSQIPSGLSPRIPSGPAAQHSSLPLQMPKYRRTPPLSSAPTSQIPSGPAAQRSSVPASQMPYYGPSPPMPSQSELKNSFILASLISLDPNKQLSYGSSLQVLSGLARALTPVPLLAMPSGPG